MSGQTLEGARRRLLAAAREWARLTRAVERCERVPAELELRLEKAESELMRCALVEEGLERTQPS